MTTTRRAKRRDAGRARGAPVAEAVLTATLEELAVSGLDGLSVERVAQRAAVNKTSVYRRWPTREELVAAALEGVLRDVEARPPDTGSLRGDLLELLGRIAGLLSRPAGRAVLRAALSESASSGVAALAGRRLKAESGSPVRAMVARARARGEWREGVKGEQLVSMLVGALMHRAMLEHAPITKPWLASLVDIALLGASPPAGPGPARGAP